MLADIVNNIYNNVINFITGQNAQDRFVNLLDSAPNILSDKDQADGYVGLNSDSEMFSVYYNEDITFADITTAAGAGQLVPNKFYLITDAVSSTLTLHVCAETSFTLFNSAIDTFTGNTGEYDLALDTFTPVGGGNANITTTTEAALAALETAGTLSLTTLYVVTDATPYKLMCKAETGSQLAKTATIVDDVYSGVVHYDVQTGTVGGGRISDGFNQFIGCLPSDWTLGSGCRRNVFYADTTGTFGDNCSGNIVYQDNDITLGENSTNNIFNAGSGAMVFGIQLQNTRVESGTLGGTFTASPDYDFLYATSEFCSVFYDGTNNYHMFADPANDRYVVTLMTAPYTVSYIGGGGTGTTNSDYNNNFLFGGM